MIKEETKIENLLRRVSNCDTEAGERLKYHLLRARCSEEYAAKLHFGIGTNWLSPARDSFPSLSSLFIFQNAPEGHDYWSRINNLMK